jgi:hypothetical protein
MQTDKPNEDIDLDETDLVHRYFARRAEVQKDAGPPSQDSALEEQVENDWFAMGDQESWIEARPGLPRSWELPRKQ